MEDRAGDKSRENLRARIKGKVKTNLHSTHPGFRFDSYRATGYCSVPLSLGSRQPLRGQCRRSCSTLHPMHRIVAWMQRSGIREYSSCQPQLPALIPPRIPLRSIPGYTDTVKEVGCHAYCRSLGAAQRNPGILLMPNATPGTQPTPDSASLHTGIYGYCSVPLSPSTPANNASRSILSKL